VVRTGAWPQPVINQVFRPPNKGISGSKVLRVWVSTGSLGRWFSWLSLGLGFQCPVTCDFAAMLECFWSPQVCSSSRSRQQLNTAEGNLSVSPTAQRRCYHLRLLFLRMPKVLPGAPSPHGSGTLCHNSSQHCLVEPYFCMALSKTRKTSLCRAPTGTQKLSV
jgi:hypothetical protein